MADFSINDTTRRVLATGNGSTTSFSFSFQVNAVTDIKVYVDGTLRTQGSGSTNYAVQDGSGSAGLSNTGTGAVVFVTAPSNNTTVTILSDIPLSRSSLYTSGGNVTASALENDFDTITMALGDAEERDFRTIKAPVQDPIDINMTLPAKASRVGKLLGFNDTTGNPEVTFTTADGQTLSNIASDIATLADLQDGTTATNALSTLASISSNITTVAGKASLITSEFATDMSLIDSTFVTKMGLVTSDFVSDMTILTADVVADLNTLATSDIVTDLNTLATSDIVTDLNLLATSDNVTNMATLGASGVVGNIATVAGVSSNVTTVAGISSNVTTVAGVSSNVTSVAGIASNVTTVATNISDVNTVASNISTIAQKASLDDATALAIALG